MRVFQWGNARCYLFYFTVTKVAFIRKQKAGLMMVKGFLAPSFQRLHKHANT